MVKVIFLLISEELLPPPPVQLCPILRDYLDKSLKFSWQSFILFLRLVGWGGRVTKMHNRSHNIAKFENLALRYNLSLSGSVTIHSWVRFHSLHFLWRYCIQWWKGGTTNVLRKQLCNFVSQFLFTSFGTVVFCKCLMESWVEPLYFY